MSEPLELRAMTQPEYEALMDRLVSGYAASHAEAGDWSPEEAGERAAAETARLLPEGLATPGMVFLTAEAAGHPVGRVWLALGTPRAGEGWIYYIEVDGSERNKGYGRALLAATERECAARGLGRLGLNVFGQNASARHLYESAGYETTSLQMRKELSS